MCVTIFAMCTQCLTSCILRVLSFPGSLRYVITSVHTFRSRSTRLPRTPLSPRFLLSIHVSSRHASRYLELYFPTGSIEIAHTSRYAHRTGKSELCILAARSLTPGSVITELKGSMADLTEEEDQELKRANTAGISGIRRDFSVIHSKQLKKNHLFLGPARFVNASFF
jgi:hypothetical protein